MRGRNLIEETLNLIKAQMETDDEALAEKLEKRIEKLAAEAGEVRGYLVRDLGGEWLACCLGETQARALQTAFLTHGRGVICNVVPVTADLTNFVHPESEPNAIVDAVLQGED